jgi:hypothetical protein
MDLQMLVLPNKKHQEILSIIEALIAAYADSQLTLIKSQ